MDHGVDTVRLVGKPNRQGLGSGVPRLTKLNSIKFGRLTQGNGRVKGTNTMFSIHHHEMTKNREATYATFVSDIRPQKKETHRTRLTVGGNLINYPGNVSTEAADLTTTKILFNSVISTHQAKFMGIDIKNFYLEIPIQ